MPDDPPAKLVRVEWAIVSHDDSSWFRCGVTTMTQADVDRGETPPEIPAALKTQAEKLGEAPPDLMSFWNYEPTPVRVRS